MHSQAQEDVSKNLVHIKNMLYGTAESEPQADIVVAQLAQELYNSNLLLLLVQNLSRIDFEASIHFYLFINLLIHLIYS